MHLMGCGLQAGKAHDLRLSAISLADPQVGVGHLDSRGSPVFFRLSIVPIRQQLAYEYAHYPASKERSRATGWSRRPPPWCDWRNLCTWARCRRLGLPRRYLSWAEHASSMGGEAINSTEGLAAAHLVAGGTVRRVPTSPDASVLIESMRDVGYTLDTALADIVDNSIAAGAASVRILADTVSTKPSIGILDDGRGMTAEELLEAMRLGNRSPRDERVMGDLGRFGLGLKTASLSQCRRVTVVSRKNGMTAAARWDLDTVRSTNEWLVEVPEDTSTLPWADRLGERGTLVLWEELDRLLLGEPRLIGERRLVRRLDEAATELELVFHRFLSGERGLRRLKMSLNGRPLEAFDPFHSRHAATMPGPVEVIRLGQHRVTIQAFTLPHHQKVTPAEWDRYGGREGYLRSQGFYVYRGGRLIIHGTWFGLARQMELTKLARVRIDIPTGLDSEWKIDIKKASAQLPPQVRDRLRRLIETIGATSKGIYTTRGRRLATRNPVPVWQRVQNSNEVRYSINLEHPVISAYCDGLSADLRRGFVRVVEMLGASLPIDAIFADTSDDPTHVTVSSMSADALDHAVMTTVAHLRKLGLPETDISGILQSTEPFRSQWHATNRFLTSAGDNCV